MKRGRVLLVILLMMALSFSTSAVLAGGEKGASASAYEHASDESVFNRVGDWFATIGKTEEEAAAIRAERAATRAAKRAEKEAAKGAKEVGKAAEKAKKKLSY